MEWMANRPETTDAIPNFRAVRPSPTNPHRRPFYIDPAKLKRNDSTSSSEITSVKNEEPISMNNKEVVLRTNIEEKKDEDPTKIDHFEMEPKKEAVDKTKFPRLVKWAVGLTILVASAVAAIMFVNYYTHPFTYGQGGLPVKTQLCTRVPREVSIGDSYVLKCKPAEEPESLNITFSPELRPTMIIKSISLTFQNESKNWETDCGIIQKNFTSVTMTPSLVKCNSSGHYTLTFRSISGEISKHIELLKITNNLLNVSLDVNNQTNDQVINFSCSVSSGCKQANIVIMGVYLDIAEPLFSMTYTCVTKSNYKIGFTTNCVGVVPAINAYNQSLIRVVCRASTGNVTVQEEEGI